MSSERTRQYGEIKAHRYIFTIIFNRPLLTQFALVNEVPHM
jgi:hypothetical protein